MMTLNGKVLSVGSWSGFMASWLVVAVAVLVNVPGVSARTTIVKVALTPRFRVPIGKVSVLPTGVTPPLAETNVTPDGRVSVSVTPGVGEAPLLATVII